MSSSRSAKAEAVEPWGAIFAEECANASMTLRSSIGGTPIKKEQEEKQSPVTKLHAKRHSEGSSTPRSGSKRPGEQDPSNSNKKGKPSAPKEAKAAPPARKKSPAKGASAKARKNSNSAKKPARAPAMGLAGLTAADRKVVADYRKFLEVSAAAAESGSATQGHPHSHASRRQSGSPGNRRTSFGSSSSHRSRRASEPGAFSASSATTGRAAAAVQRTPRYNNNKETGVAAPPPGPPMQADALPFADDVVEVVYGHDADGVELVHDEDAEPEVIVVAKPHHGFWKKTAAVVLFAFVLALIAIAMSEEISSIHSDHSLAPFVADQPDTPTDFKINWSAVAVVVAAALATLVAHGW